MSNKERTTIDLVNGPADRGVDTSERAKDWVQHLWLNENEQVKRDISTARSRMGQFSARFVVEAICEGEPDGERLAAQMISYLNDPDQLIDEISIDPRALKKLAQNVGGKRADHVVQNSALREIREEDTHHIKSAEKQQSISDQQIELLRALLKTMDPEVVKRALVG
jgi:hypothetical protein